MSVTLSEVTRAAKAHRAPLAGESAGYLVLAIADQVLNAPRLVQPGEIQLAEDGGLRVLSGSASSDAEAELSLRRALDTLLAVASSGSAALTRASRRTLPVGLAGLVRELEAALIPVNRAAARRALARLHRETARALESGALLEEDAAPNVEVVLPVAVAVAPAPVTAPVAPAPVAPPPVAVVPVAAPPVAVVPVAAPPVAVVPAAAPPRAVAECEADVRPGIVIVDDSDLETHAIRVAPALPPELSLLPQWDAMLNALCEESPERAAALDEPGPQESDALTVALEVRPIAAVAPAASYDEDVDFDEIDEIDAESESAAAPTVLRNVPVAPVPDVLEVEQSAHGVDEEVLSEIPVEACTRPEPVVLRKAMRPVPAAVAELTELAPMVGEILSHTPTLGSLVAQLPVLAPERLAELNAQAECEPSAAPLAVRPSVEAPQEDDQVMCSAVNDTTRERGELAPPTERTPEVAPLPPGVSMLASRKSDISELLQSFQVAEDDSSPGLRRAIKEMAELDLTPAPFAALIR